MILPERLRSVVHVLQALIAVGGALALLPACGRGQPDSGASTAAASRAGDSQAGDEKIHWSYISLSGKSPIEATVLPLRHFRTYLPVVPAPPATARDYDERMAIRQTALKMIESKNVRFLNSLNDAVAKLDPEKEWQEGYEAFLKAGRAEGGYLGQLERAHTSGEICPPGACGADAPRPKGCPHTHKAKARWAPDGSLMGVDKPTFTDTPQEQFDALIVDFTCGRH
ncbi:MAG: hypothetical protein DMF49_04510 [Acidobacteria bacterium]|nr:MAG: hypothetical protein DMF49_04510 [Acidobacteriota bacterium]